MESIINCLKKSFIEISYIIENNKNNTLFELIEKSNKSGDSVKKLDIVSNNILKKNLISEKEIKYIGSEEDDELILINKNGQYLLCFDPLDGSSNIDVNVTVGTIFALYKYDNNKIKNGHNIVMAGYCLYGGSTQLILSIDTIDIYQLDKCSKIFNPIFKNWKIPYKGPYYSINESNKNIMNKNYMELVDKFIKDNYSARWIGSLVADAHRTLIKGGFFAYPENKKNKNGKLRLLYEAYPMAYIFKFANGYSSNGVSSILDIPFPENIHQKTPLILSSKSEFSVFKIFLNIK